MAELFVLTYESADKANEVLVELGNLQKQQLLELQDAAIAVKDEKGKVKVTQTLEKMYTGSSAVWGGFWGLLIGLIFGGPIFWALFGGIMAVLFSKGTDLGIDNQFIKEVGDSLDTGEAALFMLVQKATKEKVIDDLKQYGGKVYQTSLSAEDEEKLKKALENEDIAKAVEETHELA